MIYCLFYVTNLVTYYAIKISYFIRRQDVFLIDHGKIISQNNIRTFIVLEIDNVNLLHLLSI